MIAALERCRRSLLPLGLLALLLHGGAELEAVMLPVANPAAQRSVGVRTRS